MKKLFYIFIGFVLLFALISIPVISSAATLDNVTVETSKEKIAPGDQVKVTVSFGKDLGAYTVNVAYDSNIFDYVSSEGGTANNSGNKVILTYYDSTGGTNPSTTASVTFKAKAGLLASNPTDLSVTLEGMANADASERYDDITTAYIKDVLVEPNYVDYTLTLNYTGAIKKDVSKDMALITASTMGKNYDHVRLVAEVLSKPTDTATAKLLATQDDGTEIDLLESGWGEADGYALGGGVVNQRLQLKGLFNTDGKYTVHVKLIDRDDSDKVIVQKSFNINVGETKANDKTTEEKLPAAYPTTGSNQYALLAIVVISLIAMYVALNKKSK